MVKTMETTMVLGFAMEKENGNYYNSKVYNTK